MKFIFSLLLLCSINLYSQDTNKVEIDSVSGKRMLTGIVTREAFSDTSFSWWFNSGYEFYETDTATVDLYKDNLLNTDIVVIMGTWCSDSRTHIPHLLKILDYAEYPEDRLKLISVGRDKQAHDPAVKDMKIELVPTILFYAEGIEIGRIVETPESTLEEDMAVFLQ